MVTSSNYHKISGRDCKFFITLKTYSRADAAITRGLINHLPYMFYVTGGSHKLDQYVFIVITESHWL